jgi:hypothetical protein
VEAAQGVEAVKSTVHAVPLIYRAKGPLDALRVFAEAAKVYGGWAPQALARFLAADNDRPLTAIMLASLGEALDGEQIGRLIEAANTAAADQQRDNDEASGPGPAKIDYYDKPGSHFTAVFGSGRTFVEVRIGKWRPVVIVGAVIPLDDLASAQASMIARAQSAGVAFTPMGVHPTSDWEGVQEELQNSRRRPASRARRKQ